jgi:hypothetical protein
MAVFRGLDGEVRIGTTLYGETGSFTITETGDTIDTSRQRVAGDARTYFAGLNTHTGSIEAHFDPDDAGQDQISIGSSVEFTLYPAGRQDGLQFIRGTGKITNIETASQFDNQVVSFNIQYQGTGELEKGVNTEVASVSGAGSTQANGFYAEDSGDWVNVDDSDLVFEWEGSTDEWNLIDDGTTLYVGSGGTITGPWTATTWSDDAGSTPVPTVQRQFLAIT